MLSRMLSRRLEVDHECEMAFELLIFIKLNLDPLSESAVLSAVCLNRFVCLNLDLLFESVVLFALSESGSGV
ncbi:hypothetical protein Tco_0791425 [Tanacetum coccineum]